MQARRCSSRHPTHGVRTAATLAASTAFALLPLTSCAAPRGESSAQAQGRRLHAPDSQRGPIDAETAAALAVARSPRVAAAARRFEASEARLSASQVPPDPTVALGLGIPIDGLGGTGLSASIGGAIGWLFTREAAHAEARSLATLAADELVRTARVVAADAREAARVATIAQAAHGAARDAASASATIVRVAEQAVAESEMPRVLLAEARSEALAADLELARRAADERLSRLALASLAGCDESAELAPSLPPGLAACHDTDPSEATAPPTIEVIRAARMVAAAQAELARLESPLGPSSQISAGFTQDLEDRRSVETGLSLTLPLFRRGSELDAARAELDAAQAELEEASRGARLAQASGAERVRAAREALLVLGSRRALAEELLLAARAASEAGEATALVVAEARMRTERERLAELDGAHELVRALAEIERLGDAPQTDTSVARNGHP